MGHNQFLPISHTSDLRNIKSHWLGNLPQSISRSLEDPNGAGGVGDADQGAEVLLKPGGLALWRAIFKTMEARDVRPSKLKYCLIVVADDAKFADEILLYRILVQPGRIAPEEGGGRRREIAL
jgi:hypothetical protein